MLAILLACLHADLFSILFSIVLAILFASLFAVATQMLHFIVVSVIGQRVRIGTTTCSVSSHADFSERLPELDLLQELAMMVLVL